MVSEIFPSGPTYFQVQLQNDSFHSYVAGQTIIGRVVVELKDKLKIMALKIELLGKGTVQWEKEHYFSTNGRRGRRGAIPTEESYIYQEKYLIGERAEATVILCPGVHSFPFFFTLSPWLPSSFEGRHCHVRYTLHATLKRALFKDVKSDPLKFLIKGILDLNQYPTVTRPISVCESKNWDFACWKLWSVALNLSVEKTGFVPGENLPFVAKFINSCSNVKLTPVKAYFIQVCASTHTKVTVKAPTAKSAYEYKVLKISGPPIDAGEVKEWSAEFEIPHVEPSGLGLYPSQVLRFNVQYFLRVTAKNAFSTISRTIGLTIGTIPIRDTSASVPPTGSIRGDEVIMTFGASQFTPFRNLSDVFLPAVNNALSRSTANCEVVAENAANVISTISANNAASGSVPVLTPLIEQSQSGISTSLTILTETVKPTLKRTDTPPPSYEEAIKRQSGKKS